MESVGISSGDTKKLIDAGFNTIESILMTARKNMIGIKGLTEAKLDKIIEAANKLINMN